MADKPKRKTRTEKLFDARLAVNKAANQTPDKYVVNRLLNGIDHLFFEVEMLIHEVQELKAKKGGGR